MPLLHVILLESNRSIILTTLAWLGVFIWVGRYQGRNASRFLSKPIIRATARASLKCFTQQVDFVFDDNEDEAMVAMTTIELGDLETDVCYYMAENLFNFLIALKVKLRFDCDEKEKILNVAKAKVKKDDAIDEKNHLNKVRRVGKKYKEGKKERVQGATQKVWILFSTLLFIGFATMDEIHIITFTSLIEVCIFVVVYLGLGRGTTS
ncbi:hypothetical protein ACJX0J_016458, partial [Zea mays]